MAVVLASQFTQREYRWSQWLDVKEAKELVYQYDEEDGAEGIYTIWGYDGPEAYLCKIYKGTVPQAVIDAGYTQQQNDADQAEFEADYKAGANGRIDPRLAADGRLLSATGKTFAPKLPFITPNYCNETTWWPDALRVVDEVAVDSGDHQTYTLAHGPVIDAYHGKITFEDALKDANGYDYRVRVTVDDVDVDEVDPETIPLTSQDPWEGTGDYVVDYANHTITFRNQQSAEAVVEATYHYANGSTFYIRPSTGHLLIIDKVEIQISEDVCMNDSVIFQPWGYEGKFDPEADPESKTLIPIGPALVYKTINDVINDSNKAYPLYPPFNAGGWRGYSQNRFVFSWDYDVGSTVLDPRLGMEVRVKLKYDKPFIGELTTAAFNCTSEPTT